MTSMETRTAPRQHSQGLRRGLIIAEGLITLYAVVFVWPVGVVLVLGNVVGAIVSGGVNRRMFVVIAVLGAIPLVFILLFGLAASTGSVPSIAPVPS